MTTANWINRRHFDDCVEMMRRTSNGIVQHLCELAAVLRPARLQPLRSDRADTNASCVRRQVDRGPSYLSLVGLAIDPTPSRGDSCFFCSFKARKRLGLRLVDYAVGFCRPAGAAMPW